MKLHIDDKVYIEMMMNQSQIVFGPMPLILGFPVEMGGFQVVPASENGNVNKINEITLRFKNDRGGVIPIFNFLVNLSVKS
jgi:hypothetical protein